jgi:sulfur carrier protein ThiS
VVNVTARISGIREIKRFKTITCALADETSLEMFLLFLSGQLGQEVLQADILVVLNGRAVRGPERAQIVLKDGDIVSVVRAFAGG